jgi:hypothetical protein
MRKGSKMQKNSQVGRRLFTPTREPTDYPTIGNVKVNLPGARLSSKLEQQRTSTAVKADLLMETAVVGSTYARWCGGVTGLAFCTFAEFRRSKCSALPFLPDLLQISIEFRENFKNGTYS